MRGFFLLLTNLTINGRVTTMNTAIKNSLITLGSFGIFFSLAGNTSAAYFDNAPAPRCDVQITTIIHRGSNGMDVTLLQSFLNRAGYLTATPNGHYGPATTAAVRAFQRDNFLPPTGFAGEATLDAVNERFCDIDLRGDSLSYSDYGYSSYESSYGYGYSSGCLLYTSPSPRD